MVFLPMAVPAAVGHPGPVFPTQRFRFSVGSICGSAHHCAESQAWRECFRSLVPALEDGDVLICLWLSKFVLVPMVGFLTAIFPSSRLFKKRVTAVRLTQSSKAESNAASFRKTFSPVPSKFCASCYKSPVTHIAFHLPVSLLC